MFFGLSQAVVDLSTPILRVLDAKKHVVWGHRSPKHNLQHANYLNGFFFYVAGFGIFGRHKILCEAPQPQLASKPAPKQPVPVPDQPEEQGGPCGSTSPSTAPKAKQQSKADAERVARDELMQRRDGSYKDSYKPRWIIYCTTAIAPMIVEGAEIKPAGARRAPRTTCPHHPQRSVEPQPTRGGGGGRGRLVGVHAQLPGVLRQKQSV